MKKQKKIVSRIAAGVLLAAVIIVTVALFISGSDGRNYRKHIDLAQRYIDELQYEQAIAEYEAAIRIDPNNAETYQALAELYVLMEDYESAAEILSRGIEQTESEVLAVRLEEVQAAHEEQIVQAKEAEQMEVQQNEEQIKAKAEVGQEQKETNDLPVDIDENIIRERTEHDEYGNYVVLEYNENGNLLKKTIYNLYEIVEMVEEYDNSGNCTKTVYYNGDGKMDRSYVYEYNGNGQCVKQINYNADGSYEVDEYDENGNHVDTWYDADGTVVASYEYVDMNLVKRAIYFEGVMRAYEISDYDENGNCTSIIGYNDNGLNNFCVIYEIIYEYNEDGNCIRRTDYDESGSINLYVVYEYDEDGNFINSTAYNADGTLYIYEVYEPELF